MSIPYEQTGRVSQKARTRAALVAAVRELLAEGGDPQVEDAAARAGISRTTAYRYFRNRRALLLAAHPELEALSLVARPAADPAERYRQAVDALIDLVLETEHEQRATLRLSLDADALERRQLVLRQGRAIQWLEEALSPLRGRLPDPELRRLALATRAACGIESLVWLTDVAGLSRREAAATMRWSAGALFAAANHGF